MAPAVQTGPDSEQQCVVPEAQALGSLAQVCLPLGAQTDTQCKIKEKSPFALPDVKKQLMVEGKDQTQHWASS